MDPSPRRIGGALVFVLMVVLAACGGGGASPSVEATASPTPEASTAPSEEATPSPSAATGEATLDAPDEIDAGADFEVAWTGPNAQGDYITVVPVGATEWTNADDYFSTIAGSPGNLTAPLKEGAYELWYVSGDDEEVLTTRPITVTAFTGDLLGPDEVAGGTEFEVAWNGPNGTGDYITIVPLGAGPSDYLSYWDAHNESPGTLVAPVKAGDYELWYVTGTPREVMLRRPISVLEVEATVEGPTSIAADTEFEVEWTGPNGPGDYITIVPVGSEPNAYLSYWDANRGSPGTLTSPEGAGEYELWYVIPGRREGPTAVYARQPIEVTP